MFREYKRKYDFISFVTIKEHICCLKINITKIFKIKPVFLKGFHLVFFFFLVLLRNQNSQKDFGFCL